MFVNEMESNRKMESHQTINCKSLECQQVASSQHKLDTSYRDTEEMSVSDLLTAKTDSPYLGVFIGEKEMAKTNKFTGKHHIQRRATADVDAFFDTLQDKLYPNRYFKDEDGEPLNITDTELKNPRSTHKLTCSPQPFVKKVMKEVVAMSFEYKPFGASKFKRISGVNKKGALWSKFSGFEEYYPCYPLNPTYTCAANTGSVAIVRVFVQKCFKLDKSIVLDSVNIVFAMTAESFKKNIFKPLGTRFPNLELVIMLQNCNRQGWFQCTLIMNTKNTTNVVVTNIIKMSVPECVNQYIQKKDESQGSSQGTGQIGSQGAYQAGGQGAGQAIGQGGSQAVGQTGGPGGSQGAGQAVGQGGSQGAGEAGRQGGTEDSFPALYELPKLSDDVSNSKSFLAVSDNTKQDVLKYVKMALGGTVSFVAVTFLICCIAHNIRRCRDSKKEDEARQLLIKQNREARLTKQQKRQDNKQGNTQQGTAVKQ